MTEQNARARRTSLAYDSAASHFTERTATRSEMAAAFFERFVTAVPEKSLIADLGCGPGHDVRRLIQAGHMTIAVDRSPGLLARCPREAHRIRGDLRQLPLATGGVGAIWCSHGQQFAQVIVIGSRC